MVTIMLRTMIFIDYENFDISLSSYYKSNNLPAVRLDYNKFPRKLTEYINPDFALVKTFMFVPKPDEFLMQDPYLKSRYEWFDSIRTINNLTIIEGAHIARPAPKLIREQMVIGDHSTYYITEKGTDVNLTAHLLTKGFMNSYDVAVIISGDTDYIPVIEILNTLGKSVIVAGVEGQNITKFRKLVDRQIILKDAFFKTCALAPPKPQAKRS